MPSTDFAFGMAKDWALSALDTFADLLEKINRNEDADFIREKRREIRDHFKT